MQIKAFILLKLIVFMCIWQAQVALGDVKAPISLVLRLRYVSTISIDNFSYVE